MDTAATPTADMLSTTLSHRDRALGMEEIRRSIALHLDSSSIIACACVNRDWHASFAPFVYNTICLTGIPDPCPPMLDLKEHQHWVLDLTVKDFVFPPGMSLEFRCLSYLALLGYTPRPSRDLDTARRNPTIPLWPPQLLSLSQWSCWRGLIQDAQCTLRTLIIHPSFSEVMTVPILEAIRGCVHLNTLELKSCNIRQQDATLFWNAISRIKTLTWRNGVLPDWRLIAADSPGSTSSTTDLLPRAPLSRLYGLSLISCDDRNLPDIHLFGHCQDLCKIFLEEGGDECLALFSGPDLWPQLREVWVWNRAFRDLSDEQWRQIISSQAGKRIESFETEYNILAAVKLSIDFVARTRPMETWTRPETLRVVDLMVCTRLSSALAQEILSSLPALEYLRFRRIRVMDIIEGQEWICRNLRELYIDIDMTLRQDQDQSEAVFHSIQRTVFQRLSTLTQLRTLSLHQVNRANLSPTYRGLDLTLRAGMDALESLTKLCSLSHAYLDRGMELADVEWMVRNWPELKRVQSSLSHLPSTRDRLKKYLNDNNIAVEDPSSKFVQ
ncbi:hypothetical protein EMPS_00024 [Entomortierella parvispora]|uniref:Uncharacterized protein n=1 Tax=Entomortierella parvispora TaxID=205924 RepID=A0A9P3H0Z0_9FUNG|nr:hypothetical protein EMPS_00024 [Entomortierella parvispora]